MNTGVCRTRRTMESGDPGGRARVLITAACGSSNPLGGGELSGDLKSIVVGSADFTESKIIAEIYAQALEANGFTVGRQFGIGSRETYIPAVQGPFDRPDPGVHRQPAAVLRQEHHGDDAGRGPAGAAQGAAGRPVDPQPVAGGGQGHRGRHRGDRAEVESQDHRGSGGAFARGEVRRAVGVPEPHRRACRGSRRSTVSTSRPTTSSRSATAAARRPCRRCSDGTVTAADIFSTSPAIEQNNLVVLEDPKNNFLAANVVPLVSSQKMSDELKTRARCRQRQADHRGPDRAQHRDVGQRRHRPRRGGAKWVKDNGFDKPMQG